ncbi:MAG: response regulator transcription factor [Anaerolineales bacterium]
MTTDDTILIIDDEPKLARSLALILQRAGYRVTTAATAREGLQFLQAGAFDLVFLDIKLPDQSGIQLLPQIRNLYPDMPVVILTAHASLETAIEAVRAGASDYLLKPIDPEAILARVNKIHDDQQQPKRRREITTQIQTLLEELHTSDSSVSSPFGLVPSSSPNDPTRYIKRGDLVLDLHTRHVFLKERDIPMAPSTFDYLVTLTRHSPQPVPYDTMVLESQGYQGLSRIEAKEITRWQIHELRKALEEDVRHPQIIITVRDIGYRLVI